MTSPGSSAAACACRFVNGNAVICAGCSAAHNASPNPGGENAAALPDRLVIHEASSGESRLFIGQAPYEDKAAFAEVLGSKDAIDVCRELVRRYNAFPEQAAELAAQTKDRERFEREVAEMALGLARIKASEDLAWCHGKADALLASLSANREIVISTFAIEAAELAALKSDIAHRDACDQAELDALAGKPRPVGCVGGCENGCIGHVYDLEAGAAAELAALRKAHEALVAACARAAGFLAAYSADDRTPNRRVVQASSIVVDLHKATAAATEAGRVAARKAHCLHPIENHRVVPDGRGTILCGLCEREVEDLNPAARSEAAK